MQTERIARFRANLEQNGFQTAYFDTARQAADYLDAAIDGTTVGIGGTITVRELEVAPRLARHNTVFWHWLNPDDIPRAATAAVYLTSVNAAAETGELVNIDGGGNRVASTLYGHERVYFIMGENKLMPDYASAVHRARNVAAPLNARRLNKDTPCAVRADRCYDCNSPQRICAALVTHWKRPSAISVAEVVIVGTALGF